MIKFQRITTTDAALYKYMEQLMTASFLLKNIVHWKNCVIIQIANRIFTVTLFSIKILR